MKCLAWSLGPKEEALSSDFSLDQPPSHMPEDPMLVRMFQWVLPLPWAGEAGVVRRVSVEPLPSQQASLRSFWQW